MESLAEALGRKPAQCHIEEGEQPQAQDERRDGGPDERGEAEGGIDEAAPRASGKHAGDQPQGDEEQGGVDRELGGGRDAGEQAGQADGLRTGPSPATGWQLNRQAPSTTTLSHLAKVSLAVASYAYEHRSRGTRTTGRLPE